MKTLNLYGKQDVRLEETDIPNIQNEDDVLIRIEIAGICGSDISRFGKIGSYNPGLTWGHEFSGVVSKIGSKVDNVNVGDKVTACPCFPCFKCDSCQKAQYSQCSNLQVLGGHKAGAFAEFIKLPSRNVIRIPDNMGFEAASFIEPSCVVVHGYNQISIKAGQEVAVVGCGTIGLLAIQWAKIYGAKNVYAFDTDDYKLNIAKKCGADYVINALQDGYMDEYLNATKSKGVAVVVESSGNPNGISNALLMAQKGGTVLLLGIPYGDVALPRGSFEKIIRSELKVIGSWNSLSAPFPGSEWETSLHYLSNGKLDVSPLISKNISLSEVSELFPQLYSRSLPFVKVLINIGNANFS